VLCRELIVRDKEGNCGAKVDFVERTHDWKSVHHVNSIRGTRSRPGGQSRRLGGLKRHFKPK